MQFGVFTAWWYSSGWLDQVSLAKVRLDKTSDYFSIPLLIKNLFQPFRQISVGEVKGSLDVIFRAWVDRMVSRFIGAMIRSFMIVIGVLWWCVTALVNVVWLLLWPLFPVFFVVGFVLMIWMGSLWA